MRLFIFNILFSLIYSCSKIVPLNEQPPLLPKPVLEDSSVALLEKKEELKKLEPTDAQSKEEDELQKDKDIVTTQNSPKVIKYCEKIDQYFTQYKWGQSNCNEFSWHHVRNSHLGHPIIWYTLGEENENPQIELNTTLILCGVHGDEITPIKFCFDILQDLKNNPKIIENKLVVIAPIVTPDSFFKKYPTRTNARGVDVNRNFPTADWKKSAKKLWKNRYGSDKRRFPGNKALSEQETIFQVNLIKRYNPSKIISVHAPLTLIDYDGPGESQKNGTKGKELLIQMSNKAGKYRINNYPFFPGSLGNWAGNERNIPTYTLELPNSDWTKTKQFYSTFRAAIHHAIDHELSPQLSNKKISNNEKDSAESETVL